jgi:hypothetical protein
MNMVGSPNPILADDPCISEELIGFLHHATKESVLDLVAAFQANERVRLAMYCYHKCHLRRVGLVIATTCDLNSLVREWGLVLGEAIFDQSREHSEEPGRIGARTRPKITLARSAGRYHPPPIDLDDILEPPRSAA